jgi:hypothetical protein
MIDDLIKIAIDPVFKPSRKIDSENRFECVYREENLYAIPPVNGINLRRPYNLDLCYPVPELKPYIGKLPSYYDKKLRK